MCTCVLILTFSKLKFQTRKEIIGTGPHFVTLFPPDFWVSLDPPLVKYDTILSEECLVRILGGPWAPHYVTVAADQSE